MFIQFIKQSGGYSSCYTETGLHSVVVQKTFEIPQLQFLDLVVVPVLCNDKFCTDSTENSGMSQLRILRPPVFGSHFVRCSSPEEYMIWIFWELTSGIISVFSALGSTVGTYSASVYGCF